MNPLRRSYEAKVLVVPLGATSAELARDLVQFGLDGIRVLSQPDPAAAGTEVLGESAWETPAGGTAAIVEAADMVVLLGTVLTEVPVDLVHEVCSAVQRAGRLSAAVLVNPSKWEETAGGAAMVTLRQDVDMVVSVQHPKFAAALLDVLRGGPRAEAGNTVVEEAAQ